MGSADNPVIDLLKEKVSIPNYKILIVTQLGDDNIEKIRTFLGNCSINDDLKKWNFASYNHIR